MLYSAEEDLQDEAEAITKSMMVWSAAPVNFWGQYRVRKRSLEGGAHLEDVVGHPVPEGVGHCNGWAVV